MRKLTMLFALLIVALVQVVHAQSQPGYFDPSLIDEQCPQIVGHLIGGDSPLPNNRGFGIPIIYTETMLAEINNPVAPYLEPNGGCLPNPNATLTQLAQSDTNPDGSWVATAAQAATATQNMWTYTYNDDPGAAARYAAGQAVLNANMSTIEQIPGFGAASTGDDPQGRLGADGQPIK
jgi:hypothetical protein